ncbi:MAG: VCBS repeat-containing protein [Frankiaceae bacterium]|nr:VCBS repeat-containing protein [Frankiaceae bacterium]MBV9368360.1 VCBS repeat-containing protein [Frankiales bacterium]
MVVAGCSTATTHAPSRQTAAQPSPAAVPSSPAAVQSSPTARAKAKATAPATATATSSAAKRCGPANGVEPVDRVIAPRRPRPFGPRVVADVDGDGRPDVAQLYTGWHTAHGSFDRVVVRFADGRVVSGADLLDDGTPAPEDKLIGSGDVNGDGRAELVVEPPGNTASTAQIFTLVGGRLLTATMCVHDPAAGYFRDPGIGFFAHSNSCMPWCMESAKCMRVNGHPRLVLVDGYTHNRYGDLTIHRLYWTVKVYRLVGADLVRTATYDGSARSASALPHAWPFTNDLSCGTAHSPDES